MLRLFAEKTLDDAEELHGAVGLGDVVVAAGGGRPLLVVLIAKELTAITGMALRMGSALICLVAS